MDWMGSDLSVVNSARVSFAKESDWEDVFVNYNVPSESTEPMIVSLKLKEQDQKLIGYLAKHNHWSPFAHTSLQFRISAPIFVARQLVKHQVGGVWNEVSRRYVDDEPEFYFPDVWRGKPVNAKQGSEGVVTDNKSALHAAIEIQVNDALQMYNTLINDGVAPEQARMVLPQNTMTEWIWTGSLYFFARVCKLRLDPHAQQETREVAEQIDSLVPQEFEYAWKALMQ